MWGRLGVLTLLAVLSPARAGAAEIELQGVLRTAEGALASGTYGMGFKLYPTETGGSALFTQAAATVVVQGGVYEVVLTPFADGFFAQNPTLWLEATVGGSALPRRPLRTTPYAESAKTAVVALSAGELTCSSCVSAGQVSFVYAGAATKGGAALDLSCTGCVGVTELASGSVGTVHLQDGAVTTSKVGFAYAGATTAGGAATDLACTGCVGGGDLAASLTLAGDVTVTGALHACTSGYSGCAVGIGGAELADQGTGWLAVQVPTGLRVRNAANSAYTKLEFGGGSSLGDLAVTGGKLTVSESIGIGTASPTAPLDVRGKASASGGLEVGFDAVGSSGYYPQAALFLKDTGYWAGIVSPASTAWSDTASFVFQTAGDGRPFVWTKGSVTAPLMLLDTAGRLGIGTTAPTTTLDVAGVARAGAVQSASYVQLGPDPAACNQQKAGSLRWSGTIVEVCNGLTWKPIADLPAGGQTPKQAAASCLEILQNGYSSGNGSYWIDPTNGLAAPVLVTCDMTTDGGGWTKLSSQLATISVSKGTASWSGSDIVGTGQGTGCGSSIRQYTLNNVGMIYTQVYVLLTRTTTILQCSSIGGGDSGWYTPPWTGTYSSNGMCLWGDGVFANSGSSTAGLKLDWVLKTTDASAPLHYDTQCSSSGDNGAFTMRWFVR